MKMVLKFKSQVHEPMTLDFVNESRLLADSNLAAAQLAARAGPHPPARKGVNEER